MPHYTDFYLIFYGVLRGIINWARLNVFHRWNIFTKVNLGLTIYTRLNKLELSSDYGALHQTLCQNPENWGEVVPFCGTDAAVKHLF